MKGHDLKLMSIRRNNYENLQQGNHRSTVLSYMSTQLAEHSTNQESEAPVSAAGL